MAVKVFRFDNYQIIIYYKEDLPLPPLKGKRSLCYNDKRPEQAIEIIGEDIQPHEGEWEFCHMIDHVLRNYNVVIEEVK